MQDRLAQLLIVDDDVLLAEAVARTLRRRGFDVATANTAAGADEFLSKHFFDLAIVDVRLPDGSGLDVCRRWIARPNAPSFVVMTGGQEGALAQEAAQIGVLDFLNKPLDLQLLCVRVDRALHTATMRRKLTLLEAKETARAEPIYESAAMRAVLKMADRVASSPSSSALILGESGVGKEVIAGHVHAVSKRKHGPYVRVNLAAISGTMVEAELFGSVRGAFTDSKRDRLGYFASADSGTLLLDELCEFNVELQPKLLRAVEERRFFPVGADRERTVNVRVLAATNRDPEEAIASGRLRADLFYRLSTVTIRIPPLRDRPEDILPIAEHMLTELSAEFGRSRCGLDDEGRARLRAHRWPGNVRQLRNVLERAVMLSDHDESTLDPELLGLPPADRPARESTSNVDMLADLTGGASSGPLKLDEFKLAALDALEKAHIEKVLSLVGGSRTKAAEALGISRTTLWEKAKRYGLLLK